MVRASCSQIRSFLPPKQKRNTLRNFEMKRLFRNAFSERSKRSEKERDKRSLHGVPGPCSQVRPFLLAELKRDTPRNFDMKRLIRNAFSERPIIGCLDVPMRGAQFATLKTFSALIKEIHAFPLN